MNHHHIRYYKPDVATAAAVQSGHLGDTAGCMVVHRYQQEHAEEHTGIVQCTAIGIARGGAVTRRVRLPCAASCPPVDNVALELPEETTAAGAAAGAAGGGGGGAAAGAGVGGAGAGAAAVAAGAGAGAAGAAGAGGGVVAAGSLRSRNLNQIVNIRARHD